MDQLNRGDPEAQPITQYTQLSRFFLCSHF